jgi:probable HAF family extracellular repeat protein
LTSEHFPGNSVSKAYALDSAGEAAGTSSSPTAAIAVIFSGGKTTSISTLGSDVSVATAMNGSSQIAGYNIFYSNPNSEFQAFLYSNGSMKNINSASLFPAGTAAWGINDSGQVVGTGYLSSSNFHAFLYSGGKMVDLGPKDAYQASAVAINNSGQVVGSYYLNSGKAGEFLYSNGKMTTLPVPAGSSSVSAFSINGNGEIAGAIYPSSGDPAHAASFNNGVWTDLGAISGALASTAKAVNISGQVVGTAVFRQTQYHPPKPGKHVPFIATANGLVDLNTLIPPGTGFTLTDAVAINDSGQILCDANNAAGSEHAVLLSPKEDRRVVKSGPAYQSSLQPRAGPVSTPLLVNWRKIAIALTAGQPAWGDSRLVKSPGYNSYGNPSSSGIKCQARGRHLICEGLLLRLQTPVLTKRLPNPDENVGGR